MTSPDPTAILVQINAAREQVNQTLAQVTSQLALASEQAAAAARDRAAIQAIAQQTVRVDTSVGTRVFAGDTMVHGDTGVRHILSEGLPAGTYMRVRRVGDLVEVFAHVEGGTEASIQNQTISQVPEGFRPPVTTRGLYGESGSVPTKLAAIQSSGALILYSSRDWTKTADLVNFTYTTKNAWPTSLPGTVA